MLMGEPIGQVGDAESCCGGRDQRCAVVALEAPLRTNRDDPVAVHELPGFGSLHEGLMGGELLWGLRRPMRLDIVRACDQLPVDTTDASCDQAGVLKIADPYRTVVALRNEVDEAIAVAGLDVELRVASCHFREDRSEVGRAERKRRGDAQTATKVAGGQYRFPGRVNLGADPGCIVSECGPGFCERRPASGSRKQLDTKFRFKPQQATTDDRLGHAEPERSRRDPACIRNLYECL